MLRYLLIISFLASFACHAQDDREPGETSEGINQQIWLDYNPYKNHSERLKSYGALSFRIIFPTEWIRFMGKAGVAYKIKPFIFKGKRTTMEQLHGGLSVFFTANFSNPEILEIRPYQGYRITIPDTEIFNFEHYVRFEERLEFQLGGEATIGLRFRYRIKTHVDYLLGWTNIPKKLYLPFSVEFFGDIIGGQQFNDVIRITPGIGWIFNAEWRGEFHMSYHRTRDAIDEGFSTNDVVFRVRVFQNRTKKKKRVPKEAE